MPTGKYKRNKPLDNISQEIFNSGIECEFCGKRYKESKLKCPYCKKVNLEKLGSKHIYRRNYPLGKDDENEEL